LAGGGRQHNSEAGLEEKAVQQNEVFMAASWSDKGDAPVIVISVFSSRP
jgi:hypothetical protein